MTCGKGKKSRYRKCKSLDPSEIYNYPTTKASGLLFSSCDGKSDEIDYCDAGPCKSSDCKGYRMPNKFYSFAGRPATGIGMYHIHMLFHYVIFLVKTL